MLDLVLPRIDCISLKVNTGSYRIGPASSDIVLSLANSLRRVLISSLPGAAITSIKIEGVKHEFQDILGVREDVTDIVQNLKRVCLRSFTDAPASIYLDVYGPCIATAGDINVPGTVEIVNTELPIATLDNEKAHLQMELLVETGRGFVSAQSVQARMHDSDERLPIGVILVDAIYSPILHVKYSIEHTRSGDFVLMEITTDGTITPTEAMRSAALILIQQFLVFAKPFEYLDATPLRPGSSDARIPDYIYNMPIADLDLQFRSTNVLLRHGGITKVGQVLEMSERDLLLIRNFGEKSLQELVDALKVHGCFPTNIERRDSWEES